MDYYEGCHWRITLFFPGQLIIINVNDILYVNVVDIKVKRCSNVRDTNVDCAIGKLESLFNCGYKMPDHVFAC